MLSLTEIAELEKKLNADGETLVRKNLNNGIYGEGKKPHVKAWLDKREKEKREDFEDKKIAVAQEENNIAKEANLISWTALILSVIAILVAFFK